MKWSFVTVILGSSSFVCDWISIINIHFHLVMHDGFQTYILLFESHSNLSDNFSFLLLFYQTATAWVAWNSTLFWPLSSEGHKAGGWVGFPALHLTRLKSRLSPSCPSWWRHRGGSVLLNWDAGRSQLLEVCRAQIPVFSLAEGEGPFLASRGLCFPGLQSPCSILKVS